MQSEIVMLINQGKNSSIHLQAFPKIPTKWKDEKLFEKWEKFIKLEFKFSAAAFKISIFSF